MHNDLINYNSVDSEMVEYNHEENDILLGFIKENIKNYIPGIAGVAKRGTHVDAANQNREKCMQILNTQRMSVMYSSSDFVHHFILYRMDDGRIADIYIRLTEDKKLDVFEYNICVEH